jgi:hypothetical protein
MSERKNWKTKLVAKIQSESLGEFLITPLDSINPRIDTPHDVLNSTEAENIGYIRRPMSFSFDMTIPAVGDVVSKITRLQLTREEFDIHVQVFDESEDWTFTDDGVVFENCIITGGSPTPVSNADVPRATFNGNFLSMQTEGISRSGN